MGSYTSKSDENNYISQIKNINVHELDLSKIDALQLNVLKEMAEKLEKVEKCKSDRILWKLPSINLCAPSLI